VFLIEQLHERPHDPMPHLKAIVFVRPTEKNIKALAGQLRGKTYGEYHVFFSNACSETLLRDLAAADEDELVVQVQEYYADVVAMDARAFTLDLGRDENAALTRPERWSRGVGAAMDRCVEGIASVLLALKRRPFVRHQRSSESARRLAGDVARLVYEREAGLFDFRRRDEGSTHVLILDRFDDAVTPLLSQWTYQAMVHEIFGISSTNRVDLTHVQTLSKDLRELVLSAREDRFFAENMYANYGDLGASVKALVDEFQQQTKMNKKIESIDDMTRFVESYPEFRAKSGNVSKHVALMSELSAVIERRRLMAASQVEQEIVCGTDRAGAFAQVVDALQNPSIMEEERLKLVLLFALRYEGETTQIADLTEILMRQGVSRRRVGLVRTIVTLAGEKTRTGDLFGNRSFLGRASKVVGSLKGVENVYTQHSPLLASTIQAAAKGALKSDDYPFVGPSPTGAAAGKPTELIIFIVGGVCYEETKVCEQFNASRSGVSVVVGGSTTLTARSFIDDLLRAQDADG
jgi:vacuolar protein sorting-associated protein 45